MTDPATYHGRLVGVEFELETLDGKPSDKTTLTIEVHGGRWAPIDVTIIEGNWRLGGGGEGRIISFIDAAGRGAS